MVFSFKLKKMSYTDIAPVLNWDEIKEVISDDGCREILSKLILDNWTDKEIAEYNPEESRLSLSITGLSDIRWRYYFKKIKALKGLRHLVLTGTFAGKDKIPFGELEGLETLALLKADFGFFSDLETFLESAKSKKGLKVFCEGKVRLERNSFNFSEKKFIIKHLWQYSKHELKNNPLGFELQF